MEKTNTIKVEVECDTSQIDLAQEKADKLLKTLQKVDELTAK